MIGTTVSHYRILEKLGEGGMGVVYKAQDTSLDRVVALKFLPTHLSASEQDKARFIQEARASSAINHPNICTVYSIDEHEGQLFIAMEYVDGQTLHDLVGGLQTTPLQQKRAVDIGIQIAEGLAAAHEKGIVHRDIKPENIMIRKDGIVQIMDFGLAKLRGIQGKSARLTKVGSTVGTVGYMSPEQVQGQDVDQRSDIFSLGVVLYELFTGALPFKGVHETALLYEIVNVDPVPMSAVRPEIDPALDAIVLECLAKEPGERYQSAAEVAKELRRFKRESARQRVSRVITTRSAFTSSPAQPPAQGADAAQAHIGRAPLFQRLWIILACVSLAAAVAFAYLYFRLPAGAEPSVVFTISPPEKGGFESPVPAVSPDGRMIACVAHDSTGTTLLWIRSLGSKAPRPLDGTEGASFPFWSPDSRFVGFFAPEKLKKVAVAGGLPQTICSAANGRGGTWNREGTIVFAADFNVGLSQVSASGGAPSVVTVLDTVQHDVSHRLPCFLPDGRHFVYLRNAGREGKTGTYMHSLDGKDDRFLFSSQTNAIYVSPGYLLSLREKSLVAYKFDPAKGEVQGDGAQILDNVGSLANYNLGAFSASQNGTVAVMEGVAGGRQLIWFDRSGKELKRTVVTGSVYDFHLSPDERRVVFRRVDGQTSNQDIWLLDVARNVQTRFTFDPAIDDDPVWSPDGGTIIYDSNPDGVRNLYMKTSTGGGNPQLILTSSFDKNSYDWSRDGRFLLYGVTDPVTKDDLWVLPLTGKRTPFPYLHSNFSEMDGRFSPDGQWIAYQSDESGKYEVYIQHFPLSGGKWQLSTNGGGSPEWRRDGKEIYYLSPERKLMAIDVHTTASTVEVGIPSPLFEAAVDIYTAPNRYDVSADGKSFLVNMSGFEYSSKPMTVILNWTSQLRNQ